MAITSYPRVTIQGSGAAQNPQNGLGLMILNPSTGLYEAATAATFGGGGGAGGATEANQTTQIQLAQDTNGLLTEPILGQSIAGLLFNGDNEKSAAQILTDIVLALNQSTFGISVADLLFDSASTQSVADILKSINTASYAYGQPFSEYLNTINNNTNDMKNTLSNIYNLLNTGNAKIQLVDNTGGNIGVTAGRLNVDTGA